MKRRPVARKSTTIEERIAAAQLKVKELDLKKQLRDLRAGSKSQGK